MPKRAGFTFICHTCVCYELCEGKKKSCVSSLEFLLEKLENPNRKITFCGSLYFIELFSLCGIALCGKGL